MTIEDGYAIQREWVEARAGRRAHHQGPQDRAHLARHAAGLADHRARLCAADGRHVLRDRQRHPHSSASSRRASKWSSPSCSRGRCRGPGVTLFDVLAGHRLRDARARDHRCTHRAVRPRHQGAAQGVRHHRGFRRQCRHRARRPSGEARRGRSALGRRAAVQECRDRGDRARGGGAQSSRRPASRGSPTRSPPTTSSSNAGRRHPERLVHPTDAPACAATCCMRTTVLSATSRFASSEGRPSHANARQCIQAGPARRQAADRAVGGHGGSLRARNCWPAPASTGC